jgi:hypothetical protein
MWDRFVRFLWFAEASFGCENDAMKRKAINKLEVEFSTLGEIQRSHAKLFLGFTDRGLQRGLTGFQATTRPIDFAGAQPPFLSDHQDLTLSSDEAEGSPHRRLPVLPKIEVMWIHRKEINMELRNSGRI